MDLRSILSNDSSAQKQPPRLHTPQSSFDSRTDQQRPYDGYLDRATPISSSSHSIDSRSAGPGGYFNLQSPHPLISASTPSGGAPSVYTQSPGAQSQQYVQRDGSTPYSAYPTAYVPSPGPMTPSSAHHYPPAQISGNSHSYPPHGIGQPSFHREELGHLNGHHQTTVRQMSPPAPVNQTPATPLGPPANYPRQSPYSARPSSQGYDVYRRTSIGSGGSTQSRDFGSLSHLEPLRAGSIQRNSSGTSEDAQRQRERSIESVSPKTIPKQPPSRQSSTYSQSPLAQHSVPPVPFIQYRQRKMSESIPERHAASVDGTAQNGFSHSHQPPAPPDMSALQTPGAQTNDSLTPQSDNVSLPPQPSPTARKKPNLKRNASVVSNTTVTAMPPRKRLKRDEVPVFARSARHGRSLRLNVTGPQPRPPKSQNRPRHQTPEVFPQQMKQEAALAQPPAPTELGKLPWEASITNIIPYEDLSRAVCNWIVQQILHRTPPVGGVFEIEAKLGAIEMQDNGERLNLPVRTETIFQKTAWKPTKFASTMHERQHAHLNGFLNEATKNSMVSESRIPIYYSHPKESDEFWELTDEGRRALPQSLTNYLNPKHKLRVRKTFILGEGPDQGTQKQPIIKTRIADLEIYNPESPFDFRISISLEYNWNGPPEHLAQLIEGGNDRQKDRMSYKHLGYQIDLTQVRFPGTNDPEHELEIEVSTPMLQAEMQKVKDHQPNQYEELIKGLLDNLRLLNRTAAAA